MDRNFGVGGANMHMVAQDSSRFNNNVSFPSNQYQMNNNEMLRVGALNQRSVQNVGNNTINAS